MQTTFVAHVPFDGFGKSWAAVERFEIEPTLYQSHVLECVTALRDAGFSYNSDVGPRAAEMMTARFGYEPIERDDKAEWGLVSRDFGSQCYYAGSVYRARAVRAANLRDVAGLSIGQKFPRLLTQDGRTITSAVIVRFTHTGSEVELTCKRGAAVAELKCSSTALLQMSERAAARKQRLAAKRA